MCRPKSGIPVLSVILLWAKGEEKAFFFSQKETKSNHIKLPLLPAQYSDADTSAQLAEEALQSCYMHSSA